MLIMAKVRDLKKDIKYMVKQFLNECYTQLSFAPGLNQENILDVIADVLELQKKMLSQLSRKDYSRGEKVKINYKAIANDFYNKILELTERLHSIDD